MFDLIVPGKSEPLSGAAERLVRDDSYERRPAVCMLTNLFSPIASGSANQTLGLSRALAAAGKEVVVVTAHVDPASAEHETIDGVHVYRLPAVRLPEMAIALNFPWLNWTLWPANLRRLEVILRRHQVGVLHVHNHMFDLALAGAGMRRRFGLPMALTVHTIVKHQVKAFNSVLYPADRWVLKRLVVDQSDVVLCPDVNIEAYVRARFARMDGIVIPYGISLPPNPGEAVHRMIRERFGLAGKRVILSLGHVHALRNRLDLVRAMPRVLERFPDVVLLVVGAVADQRPVKLARALHLDEAVIFAGPQPYEHVSAYHALAELEAMWFDQAPDGKNPLGIACMEAMYMGRPVLTVSNEDTFGRDVLKSGRDVVIVEPRQPEHLAATIIDLLADREKAKRIGASARAVALRHFAWESVAQRTAEVYCTLAPASARGVA